MRTITTIQFLLCYFIGIGITYAQFTLSGEIRPRAEYRHGYKNIPATGQQSAFYTDQRTRLNAIYGSENVEVKITLQDIRVWGSTNQLQENGAFNAIHEAWGRVKFSENFSVKLGRQEIAYDDHRIMGNVGWAQQARSHDAAVFTYNSGIRADLGIAYNQESAGLKNNYYSLNNYKAMQYIWLHKEVEGFKGSVLLLNNGKEGGNPLDHKTYFSQTIGTRLDYKVSGLSIGGAVYYQTGEDYNKTAAAPQDINANLVNIEAGYAISETTSVKAGLERQSGNDLVNPDNVNNAFTPFYGTNHKFNGFMDYYYVGNHGGSVGLFDIYFSATQKIGKVSVTGTYHSFGAAADVDASTDNNLGGEFDLNFGFKINPEVGVAGGYSQYFGTDALIALRNTGDLNELNNWGWLMVTINPTFFKSEKKSE